jgi:hypothetical protein
VTAQVAGATARVLGFLATPWPYVAWLAISAAWLVVAAQIDPYVLGFSSFATAGASGLLSLMALIRSPRHLPLAVAASLPTAVAFYVLGTYNWA